MSDAPTDRIDCGDCERTFTTVQARGLHRSRKHGASTTRNPLREIVESAVYVCPECSASFNRPSSLGVHRRHRHDILGTSPANVARRKGTDKASVALSLVPNVESKPPALDEELTVVMVARNNGALQLGLKGKHGTWLATVVGQAPD